MEGEGCSTTCLCANFTNQASAVLVVMHLKHETFGGASGVSTTTLVHTVLTDLTGHPVWQTIGPACA